MDKKWFKFGKFVELNKEEAEQLSTVELADYVKAANDNRMKMIENTFQEKLDNTITKEDFNELKVKLTEINASSGKELEARIKEFETFANTVAKRVEHQTRAQENYKGLKKFEMQLKEIDLKGEKLPEKLKGNERFEFTIKFDSGDVSGLQGYQLQPGVGQMAEPIFMLSSFFSVSPIQINNDGTAAYDDWDETSVTRAARHVTEGTAFPESEAAFIRRSVQIEKIGDSIKLTEETTNDFVRFTAELARFLTRNILRVVNSQMWNGDGSGGIFGLINRSRPFDCTTIQTKEKVAVPNLVTLVNVLKSRVMVGWYTGVQPPVGKEADGKYNPNVVFVSWGDYTSLINAQTTTGAPLYPNGVASISGVRIVPTSLVPDNTLVVGDSAYVEMIGDPEAITVELGYDGNDWSTDTKTLKARVRTALLLREVDRDGWFYVSDVAACMLALEK